MNVLCIYLVMLFGCILKHCNMKYNQKLINAYFTILSSFFLIDLYLYESNMDNMGGRSRFVQNF